MSSKIGFSSGSFWRSSSFPDLDSNYKKCPKTFSRFKTVSKYQPKWSHQKKNPLSRPAHGAWPPGWYQGSGIEGVLGMIPVVCWLTTLDVLWCTRISRLCQIAVSFFMRWWVTRVWNSVDSVWYAVHSKNTVGRSEPLVTLVVSCLGLKGCVVDGHVLREGDDCFTCNPRFQRVVIAYFPTIVTERCSSYFFPPSTQKIFELHGIKTTHARKSHGQVKHSDVASSGVTLRAVPLNCCPSTRWPLPLLSSQWKTSKIMDCCLFLICFVLETNKLDDSSDWNFPGTSGNAQVTREKRGCPQLLILWMCIFTLHVVLE